MKIYLSIALILISFGIAFGQAETVKIPEQAFSEIKFAAFPPEKVKTSEMEWKEHFGGTKKQPLTLFTLMSQGGFRAPTSKDHEKLIKDWLAAHPNAEAIVIYTMAGMTNSPDSKIKAVWIVDKDENLNLYLVRLGDCPGGTMLLKPGDETNLTREEYKAFLEKLVEAETTARREKLGMWG